MCHYLLFLKSIYYVHRPMSSESPLVLFPKARDGAERDMCTHNWHIKNVSSASSLPSVALPPYQLVSAPQAYIF